MIPKGFLPLQDTGLISVVLEASPDTSFEGMVELQQKVSAIFQADPDVKGVTSVLGVGPLNATTNVARLTVILKDRSTGS